MKKVIEKLLAAMLVLFVSVPGTVTVKAEYAQKYKIINASVTGNYIGGQFNGIYSYDNKPAYNYTLMVTPYSAQPQELLLNYDISSVESKEIKKAEIIFASRDVAVPAVKEIALCEITGKWANNTTSGKQTLEKSYLDIIRTQFGFRHTKRDADGNVTSDGLWDFGTFTQKSSYGAVERVDPYSRESVEIWGEYSLANVPSGKRIVKAEVIFGLASPSANTDPTLGIYEIQSDFVQNTTENFPDVASEPSATVALQKSASVEDGITKTSKGFRSLVNDGYPENLKEFDTAADITSLVNRYIEGGKTKLNICVKGIKTAQNFAQNPQLLLTYADERTIDFNVVSDGSKYKFTAEFIGDEGDEPVVVFAVYSGNMLVNAAIAERNPVTYDYEAEMANLPSAFTYKCFAWDSLTACTPMTDASGKVYGQ